MNSRIEGGKMSLPNKQAVVSFVRQMLREEEIGVDDDTIAYYLDDSITDKSEISLWGAGQYIEYYADDYERKIFFPENDSADRIRQSMVYDEKVKEYVNPDAVADFIFNCIDMNAVGAIQTVALVWDEPILNEDGEVEDYEESEARQQLAQMNGGWDEYALEVGQELLGVNWVERSTVIINISSIVEAAMEMAKELAEERGYDFDEEFKDILEYGLISTITHEFRHTVYEINEFTEYDEEYYPEDGGCEESVERYGREEAERLRVNEKAIGYIDAMFPDKEIRLKEQAERE